MADPQILAMLGRRASLDASRLQANAYAAPAGQMYTRSLFSSTDDVQYAKTLDSAVEAHDRDVKTDRCEGQSFCGGKVGPHRTSAEYLSSWTQWLQDWRRYYNENVNITFPSVDRGNLDIYKAQFDEFVRRFKNAGGKVTAPNLPSPPKDEGSVPWTGLLVVGGLIAATLLLREARPEREVLVRAVGGGAPPKPRTPTISERSRAATRAAKRGWDNPDVVDAEFEDIPPRQLPAPR